MTFTKNWWKKLYPCKHVKHLHTIIYQHLKWSYNIDYISPKLACTIGMLSKIRHVSNSTRQSSYFGIFTPILISQIWCQIQTTHVNWMTRLQVSAIRVINRAGYHESRNHLYKKCIILKFENNMQLMMV